MHNIEKIEIEKIKKSIKNKKNAEFNLLFKTYLLNPLPIDNHFSIIALSNSNFYAFNKLKSNINTNLALNNNKCLEIASRKGFIDIVEYLLNDDNVLSKNGNKAIEQATINGHIDIVKLLLNSRIELKNNSAIKIAIEFNQVDIFKLIINKKSYKINTFNNELINYAIQYKNFDIFIFLINLNIFKLNKNKNYSFRLAAVYYQEDIFDFLLNHQDVNPNDYNDQAIFNAVRVNNLEAIKKIKNTDKCNPFNDTFNSFLLSYELGFENITRLLWNKKYISKLNSQHHEIYLKVTKNYISNNIINF